MPPFTLPSPLKATTMSILVVFLAGLAAGWLVGQSMGAGRPGVQLIMSVPLSATDPITLHVKGKDSEGNVFDVEASAITWTATPAIEGEDFGTIDEAGLFNPGSAGVTGTITATTVIGTAAVSGSVDVELVHGAPVSLEIELA